MGFMLMQCGLGLWEMALLHLLAHSLYKAHAFLSAGTTVQQTLVRQMGAQTGAIGVPALLAGAAAVFLWLSYHAKIPGILVVPAIGISALVHWRRLDRQFLTFVATAAVLFGATLLTSYVFWGDPLIHYTHELKFQGLSGPQAVARRVVAVLQAQVDEALGLVEGHPVGDAVGEPVADDPRVVGEPVGAVPVHPAAPVVEGGREIPVEQGDPRLDARGEDRIDIADVQPQERGRVFRSEVIRVDTDERAAGGGSGFFILCAGSHGLGSLRGSDQGGIMPRQIAL